MITDQEFSIAWENKENRRIMQSAIRRYLGIISPDEVNSCKMIGLWECLKRHDPTKGRKFTTYLYGGVQIQCKKVINKVKYVVIDDVVSYMDFNRIYIRDSLDKLEEEYQDLVYSRFFERKTLKEIAEENGYSIETARRRIKKALCKLKIILTK